MAMKAEKQAVEVKLEEVRDRLLKREGYISQLEKDMRELSSKVNAITSEKESANESIFEAHEEEKAKL